ncbi:MAG: hypothetical protein A3K19_16230 [Lentisphaerae bacterium RIFOXYB12_FULL_65_16]|nr:MAG: hypothetical protein A3K18_11760 [Lentisphaerae bacterium RIFOXYA12_64_32]OGV90173.1 MAG: hypothetical protein A3K19_16230 [Lentisphaerae bacterium RIFOXYB12_FULL_65_16]
MTRQRVIVVGAGPAGLMAAIQAAEAGADVLLLEKMDRPGCKLRLTGHGRSNFTNTAPMAAFLQRFGAGARFLRPALHQFFAPELRAFFDACGVRSVAEPDGRVFPVSDRAEDVVQALLRRCEQAGVKRRMGAAVTGLAVGQGRIDGVRLASVAGAVGQGTPGTVLPADAVVVATGGLSYPATGSTGDGYAWADAVGHTLVPTRPALVGLETAFPATTAPERRTPNADSPVLNTEHRTLNTHPPIQGVSLSGVRVRLRSGTRCVADTIGEMVFTHYGVSGPAVFSVSRAAVDALSAGDAVTLSMDLLPGVEDGALDARLLAEFAAHGRQFCRTVLEQFAPRALVATCMAVAAIPEAKHASQVTAVERRQVRQWLKDVRWTVTGSRSYAEAIVTAGGVDTREVEPRTMGSRRLSGLFFAGEILDIDADTGGYNLQAAFSTGWVAGRAAAERH